MVGASKWRGLFCLGGTMLSRRDRDCSRRRHVRYPTMSRRCRATESGREEIPEASRHICRIGFKDGVNSECISVLN